VAKNRLLRRNELKVLEGDSSFAALLRQEGDEIRRDVWMVMDHENSASGRIQVGLTTVYPGCRTKGHKHPDREEIYYFTHGRGMMGVDGEDYEVQAGDTFYVRPGPHHTTRNPYDVPLEFFWITIRVE
jgi:mannose-6-phosphate isomerase-like protein (cupin superfamily)